MTEDRALVALCFILLSKARIDETLYLRSDEIFADRKRVKLIGEGGRVHRIQVLHSDIRGELDLSRRFVYLNKAHGYQWEDSLERVVRQGCDALNIHRRGVHGFRSTAVGEFINSKQVLGFTELRRVTS